MEKKLTPAQKQYMDIKNQHKDCIVFFRMGDFYETFYEDAKICSRILDITLTSRYKNSANPIPMAGVPYHSADKYISKLIKSGYKVAIAEQLSQPQPGQIVQRGVQSIVTPGTYMEDKDLKNYNFIGAICYDTKYQLSFGDFAVGEYWTKSFENIEDLLKFLTKIEPTEIVLDIDLATKDEISCYIKSFLKSFISIYDLPSDTKFFLRQILSVQTLDSFGEALNDGRDKTMGLLLNYLNDTQKTAIKNISNISFWGENDKIIFDDISIKNLEVLVSSYEHNKRYSLVNVLDKTKTSMGGRLFYNILTNPIKDINLINERLDNINYYYDNILLTKNIIEFLSGIGDIPRIISKIIYKKNSPFVWARLRQILRNIFNAEFDIYNEFTRMGLSEDKISLIHDFYLELDSALKDDISDEDVDYIKDGFDDEIDEVRSLAYHGDDLLLDYQRYLVDHTGLGNLRIKYISNQGYFVEITKKDEKKLESFIDKSNLKLDFVRRQTLKTAERYTTSHLDELQVSIIDAKDRLRSMERQILIQFKDKLEKLNKDFFDLCTALSWIDIYTSQANLAAQKSLVRPEVCIDKKLEIIGGRHIIIEEFLPNGESFISNDLMMDPESNIHIITGPNMGGKSTFLRQNALMVLLAHCGLYVPAKSAKIPLVDGIFARVGSGDVLAKNQSTFMTEMIEVSNILHNATDRSFIVLDELGRGTSTFDGLALAKAILIYIAENIKAKTLFATHYHELIGLEGEVPGLENFSVSVYETEKEVIFLKKIIKGGASKSYGIDVAKLAGIPKVIIEDSKKYLLELERTKNKDITNNPLFTLSEVEGEYTQKYNKIKNILDSLDINCITPYDALGMLKNIKEDI